MKKPFVLLLILMSHMLISTQVFSGPSQPSSERAWTKKEKEEIGKAAAAYLVKHPEFLIEASDTLRKREEKKHNDELVKLITSDTPQSKKIYSELLESVSPAVGPTNADVAIIEFFDYQCVYCSKINPVFETLEKENSGVKFVFKDYPIFGQQWVASKYAANVGVKAFEQGGGSLYLRYHNAIFNSGKDEGHLSVADIVAAAKALNIKTPPTPKAKKAATEYKLEKSVQENMQLGMQLQAMGTPFIIVMPTKNATPRNTSIFAGYPGDPKKPQSAIQALQAAIDKARAQKM